METEKSNPRGEHLLTQSFYDNPYPTYARLRRSDPVHWSDEKQNWLITRYSDVQAGLRDPRLIVRRDKREITKLAPNEQARVQQLRDFYSNWLIYVDPPDHTRLRGTVNKVFTPSVILERTDQVKEISSGLIADLQGESEFDLLHDFAAPLALGAVSSTLGLPSEDYGRVKEWSDDIVGFVVGRTKGYEGALAAEEGFERFQDHLGKIFSGQIALPKNSVLGALSFAEEQRIISRQEAFALYGNILLDGHEPIANGIANGMLALLEHPAQRNILQANPNLFSAATEELLRYQSPFQFSARIANEDIDLRDKKIKEGQKLLLMIGSANRDQDAFPDPDKLDITRPQNRHLAFAHGPHFCLGATLARPALQIAHRDLLDAFPNMQLTEEKLEWQPSLAIRELKHLPVRI